MRVIVWKKKRLKLHVWHIKVILKRGKDEFPLNVSIIPPILSYGRDKGHEMAWILELHSSSLFILCLILSWKITVCLSIPSSHPFTPMLPVFVSLCHLFMSLPFCLLSLDCFFPRLQAYFMYSLTVPTSTLHCAAPAVMQSQGWHGS